MIKFINSLATIEVNKKLEAIQIAFRSSGTVHHYLETLRMATSFASLHGVTSYLLVKNQFDDISYRQFYNIIEDWLHLLDQNFNRKCLSRARVALLANHNSFIELSKIMHRSHRTSPKDYFHVLFDLFFDKQKACNFLNSKLAIGRSGEISAGHE